MFLWFSLVVVWGICFCAIFGSVSSLFLLAFFLLLLLLWLLCFYLLLLLHCGQSLSSSLSVLLVVAVHVVGIVLVKWLFGSKCYSLFICVVIGCMSLWQVYAMLSAWLPATLFSILPWGPFGRSCSMCASIRANLAFSYPHVPADEAYDLRPCWATRGQDTKRDHNWLPIFVLIIWRKASHNLSGYSPLTFVRISPARGPVSTRPSILACLKPWFWHWHCTLAMAVKSALQAKHCIFNQGWCVAGSSCPQGQLGNVYFA